MKGQLWETRPLEFWAKAKELRAGWQDSMRARKRPSVRETLLDSAPTGHPRFRIDHHRGHPVGRDDGHKDSAFARKARTRQRAHRLGP